MRHLCLDAGTYVNRYVEIGVGLDINFAVRENRGMYHFQGIIFQSKFLNREKN